MRLSIKKATADSVSRWLQKYLDTTNILQYPKEEFARFDSFVCGPYNSLETLIDQDHVLWIITSLVGVMHRSIKGRNRPRAREI